MSQLSVFESVSTWRASVADWSIAMKNLSLHIHHAFDGVFLKKEWFFDSSKAKILHTKACWFFLLGSHQFSHKNGLPHWEQLFLWKVTNSTTRDKQLKSPSKNISERNIFLLNYFPVNTVFNLLSNFGFISSTKL